MNKITDFIGRISLLWVGLGAFIASIGFDSLFGLDLTQVFSQDTLEALKNVIGALAVFVGYLKSLAIQKIEEVEGQVKVLSAKAKSAFAFNPFKTSL